MSDLDDKLQKLENLEVKNGRVFITISLKNEELVKEYGGLDSRVRDEVIKQVVPVIVQQILTLHKETIVHQVLTEVNWPEIVRSDIAQKVIKEVAMKQDRNY